MSEECQKAKEGERMKTKKQRSGLCPQNKDGERVFFIIGLFLWVPDSLAERRRQGDRGVHVVSLQRTHIHAQTTKTAQTAEDSRPTLEEFGTGVIWEPR